MRKSRKGILTLVEETAKALERARSAGGLLVVTDRERTMLNTIFFIWLHTHDMSVAAEDFAVTRPRDRRLVYARVFALDCVEFFDDIQSLIKTTMHSDAVSGTTDEAQQTLFAAARLLRPVRRTYEPLLKSIRVNVIAHRDHAAILNLNTLVVRLSAAD
jgi:hypothetical protein